MNKTTRDIVILIVVAVVLLFGIPLALNKFVDKQPAPQETSQTDTDTQPDKTESITVTVEGLYKDKQVDITTNETVLQVLQKLNATDANLKLVTKDYPGLGTLVQAMVGKTNGTDNKYWQYKVDSAAPQIGADQFKLKTDDRVEWYFDKSDSN